MDCIKDFIVQYLFPKHGMGLAVPLGWNGFLSDWDDSCQFQFDPDGHCEPVFNEQERRIDLVYASLADSELPGTNTALKAKFDKRDGCSVLTQWTLTSEFNLFVRNHRSLIAGANVPNHSSRSLLLG